MKREDARRKRDKAIQRLRELGMTDDEIKQELGVDTLKAQTAQSDSAIPVDSDGIIDAEVVELSDTEAMREPLPHLPAVVAKPVGTDQDSETNPVNSQQYSRKSDEWWEQRKPEVQARRCKAHRKDGGRCRQVAIAGATVCRFHGGASKHVKMAARARLENASDLMAKQLLRMAIDDNVADAVKLSAIKDALDRSGLRAPTEVVLSPGQTPGYEEVFDGIYSGSRDDSRAGRVNDYDSQQDSTQFESLADSTHNPTAPAMDADSPEQASTYTRDPDSDRLRERESRERPSRSRTERERSQNGYESDLAAMHRANVENARNAADPPAMRALPRGRSSRRQI